MLTYVYGIFLVTWEVVCCKIFMESFSVNRSQYSNILRYVSFLLLIIFDYLIAVLFSNNFIIKQIMVMITTAVIMHFSFQITFNKASILVILYQGLVIMVDYTTLIVIGKCFPALTMEKMDIPGINILTSAICKMLLFCFVVLVKKKFGYKNSDILTDVEWLKFLLFPIFTIITIVSMVSNFGIVNNTRQSDVLLWVALGMLMMNIIEFYLINGILKREMQIREDKLFRERVKNETDMYRSVSDNLQNQRNKAHEYKNHISCIIALAKHEDYGKLNEYLKKIYDTNSKDMDMIDTNNIIVNAILNTKYREAREKKIILVLKTNDLSNLILEDEDIVIILSNLLNNAIDSCQSCEEKVIKIKFIKEKSSIIISVINSMKIRPILRNGKIQTSKIENQQDHGIGIENTINAVKKYDGSYVIKYDDSKFYFTILIPYVTKADVLL